MRIAIFLMPLALAACDQMREQPRDDAFERAGLFAGGQVNQTPPEGTIAREDAAWRAAEITCPPMTPQLLVRGQARYRVACVQCHGEAGDGDGVVVSRGFPRPPDFTSPQVRALSSAQIVDVIAHGYGTMYPHADRVAPADRWAIAAYIQALQLSQGATASRLPAEDRAKLELRRAR